MGNYESVPAKNEPTMVKKKRVNKSRKSHIQQQRNTVIESSENKGKQYNTPSLPNSNINANVNKNGKRIVQRENISIENKSDHNDFSNYNYEIKTKNTDLNGALVNRNMIQNSTHNKTDYTDYLSRPSDSNGLLKNPKPNFDNITFNPDNFNDKVSEYKNLIEEETNIFETNIIKQKNIFYKKQNNKKDTLEQKIKEFEDKYDPWDILGLEKDNYNVADIKRAYRKNALKYHPDKAGNKYENLFNIINQSYIYLLQKAEDVNEIDNKINQEVTSKEYDKYNDGMENIYIDKDNFSINKFNEIFDKFKVDDDGDDGYANLLKKNDNDDKEEKSFLNKKMSNEIFNQHFNNLKNKKSNALIQYDEPESLNTQGSLNVQELGQVYNGGYGTSSQSNLGYTDIKQAHYDEKLLINPDSVNYKKYNNVDEVEHERSNINYKPSENEKIKYINIEKKKTQKEVDRINHLKEKDTGLSNNYSRINKKLIIHKK